jgi:REP element-mobilizing transposase RayT
LVVLHAIHDKLQKLGHRYVIIASCAKHVHVLAELPDDVPQIRRFMGQLKRTASHSLRDSIPGRVWARGGNFEPVETKAHQRAVFEYLLRHRKAWVWSEKTGVVFND